MYAVLREHTSWREQGHIFCDVEEGTTLPESFAGGVMRERSLTNGFACDTTPRWRRAKKKRKDPFWLPCSHCDDSGSRWGQDREMAIIEWSREHCPDSLWSHITCSLTLLKDEIVTEVMDSSNYLLLANKTLLVVEQEPSSYNTPDLLVKHNIIQPLASL